MINDLPKPPGGLLDGPIGFYSWTENCLDYSLIGELIPKVKNTSELISVLNEVNRLLPENPKYIFDGTISSLVYFIEKGLLDVKKLKNPLLIGVINKYIFGTKDKDFIKMNPNRWSGQALRCKVTLIGLYVASGKIKVVKDSPLVEVFEKLNENDFPVFDDDVKRGVISEESVMRLTNINALWNAMASHQPWSQYRSKDIGRVVLEEVVHSFKGDSLLNPVIKKLDSLVNNIAEVYFPGFHKTNHQACVATRHALIAILFRLVDKIPPHAERHPIYRVDGLLYKWMEYIYSEDKTEFQLWFIDYIHYELEKRVRFLRQMVDHSIFMPINLEVEEFLKKNLNDTRRIKNVLSYIPIFEGFTFLPPGSLALAGELIIIFQDKAISTKEKDDMVKSIVFNIQRLVAEKKTRTPRMHDKRSFDEWYEQHGNSVRENFILLALNILTPIMRKVVRDRLGKSTDWQEARDLVIEKIINAILEYDSTKNSSFFGYISRVTTYWKSSLFRVGKVDQMSSSLENMTEKGLEIPSSSEDLIEERVMEDVAEKVKECLDKLPDKEQEAIKLLFFKNKRLTDTQRKAKNRGFNRIRTSYPELANLLS